MSTPPVGVPTCYRHSDRETYIRCQRCERPICPDCMRDAAVGFQCPGCIAEGRKSVRQITAAYGGKPSANPALTSIVLIVINAAVWVAITIDAASKGVLGDQLALRARSVCITSDGSTVNCVRGVSDGAYWELATSVFAHEAPLHLGFNMLALWVLGSQLEGVLGRVRFLAVYLLSGLAGSVAVYWLSDEYQGTLGASGAIFGLMGALVVIGLKVGGQMQGLLMWIGINAVITFTLPNVSWQGHLGGLLGGAAVTAVIVWAPRARRAQLQVIGLSALTALFVAAIVVRTLVLA